jgi:hypothetical protein
MKAGDENTARALLEMHPIDFSCNAKQMKNIIQHLSRQKQRKPGSKYPAQLLM